MTDDLSNSVFKIENPPSFTETALKIFKLQSERNPVYRDFISTLGIRDVKNITDIPFLPAELFRSRKVITEDLRAETVFESSMTAGSVPSRHYVHDLKIYEESFIRSFRYFYGDPSKYFIAALLPSYSERKNSSLVYMVDGLIKKSLCISSGFYKEKPEDLIRDIQEAGLRGQKTLLIGVSFAF